MKSITAAAGLFVAGLTLSGCFVTESGYNHTYDEGWRVTTDDDAPDYVSGTDGAMAAIEAANWDEARMVDVTFYQGQIRPMILHLKKDEPYKIRFINRDRDTTHAVRGEDFFSTVASRALVNGEEELKSDYLVAFQIPAEETREYHFIPAVDGRFELDNAAPGFFFPRIVWAPFGKQYTQGQTITVYVEE